MGRTDVLTFLQVRKLRYISSINALAIRGDFFILIAQEWKTRNWTKATLLYLKATFYWNCVFSWVYVVSCSSESLFVIISPGKILITASKPINFRLIRTGYEPYYKIMYHVVFLDNYPLILNKLMPVLLAQSFNPFWPIQLELIFLLLPPRKDICNTIWQASGFAPSL